MPRVNVVNETRTPLLRALAFAGAFFVGSCGAWAQETPAPAAPAEKTTPAATPETPAPATTPAPAAEETKPAAVEQASSPAPSAEDSDTGWGEKHLNYAIHGRAEIRYVGRERRNVHDRDLYETLQIDLGTEGKDKVTGAFYARFAEDLDGNLKHRGYRIFESVGDTYKTRLESLLYYGYLDIHDVGLKIADTDALKLVRVGRQQIYEVERAYFDGMKIQTGEWKKAGRLQFILYGGVPVTLYDATHGGDYLFGAGVQFRPWEKGRVRADWTYVRDENDSLFFGNHENNLGSLSVWQRIGEDWTVYGRYTVLDGDSRDGTVRVTWQRAEWDALASVTYIRQFERERDLGLAYDSFYKALRTLEPYHTVSANAHKGFCKHFALEARGSYRDLVHPEDNGPFNRRYQRWGLLAILSDLPWKGMTISLSGDYWKSPSTHVSTVGGEVEHKCTEKLTVSLGTYYSLYKYDMFNIDEREDVRTAFGAARWKFAKGWQWDGKVEVENNDFNEYTTFTTSLKLDF